jgi:hypothetical protein
MKAAFRSKFIVEILSDEGLGGWTGEERDCGGWASSTLPFFSELHIVKGLGMERVGRREEEKYGSEDPPLQKLGKSRGAEAPHLQRRGEGAPREGKAVGEKDDWLDCEQNTGNGSMGLARR